MIIKKRRLEGGVVENTLLQYDETDLDKNLMMDCGAFFFSKENSSYFPKEEVGDPQGEDAHFLCPEKQAIGVADGVGGWATMDVDAGEYARELMDNALVAINRLPNTDADLARVLNEAFITTQVKGSSTACIVMLRDNILHSINVGDSGFMIFRANRLVYQSPTQQHYFNCPYQLGNNTSCDGPSCATEIRVAVLPGDIIVLATDGLFDNVYPEEIEALLQRETSESVDPEMLAATITLNLALTNSLDHDICSPFARAAYAAGMKHRGGKIDDITVVVAHIVAQI